MFHTTAIVPVALLLLLAGGRSGLCGRKLCTALHAAGDPPAASCLPGPVAATNTPPPGPPAASTVFLERAWAQDASPARGHDTNCTCAPDPILPDLSCTLCLCGSNRPFSYGGATVNGKCGGLSKVCPTTLRYAQGFNASCVCGPDPFLRGPRWVMCYCPVPSGPRPPTPRQYTAYPVVNKTSPLLNDWALCRGPYALCSAANCTLNFAGREKSPVLMAECGCVLPNATNLLPSRSYVNPIYILDERLKKEYRTQCPNYGASPGCRLPNVTKVCREINQRKIYGGVYDFISTYQVSSQSGGFNQRCEAPPGVQAMYAQCMTAGCIRKRAFDGSPVSCYCPVYRDRVFLVGAPAGAGRPPCRVKLPYVLSGVGVGQ
ncbi:hypothetical protein DFJ74DRAFT_694724 [Hyaloraphidium curvatum]|nr:hypothetical protein DFJ74DRAFT_694724 [Hyaloraphidium curvatum]